MVATIVATIGFVYYAVDFYRTVVFHKTSFGTMYKKYLIGKIINRLELYICDKLSAEDVQISKWNDGRWMASVTLESRGYRESYNGAWVDESDGFNAPVIEILKQLL